MYSTSTCPYSLLESFLLESLPFGVRPVWLGEVSQKVRGMCRRHQRCTRNSPWGSESPKCWQVTEGTFVVDLAEQLQDVWFCCIEDCCRVLTDMLTLWVKGRQCMYTHYIIPCSRFWLPRNGCAFEAEEFLQYLQYSFSFPYPCSTVVCQWDD